MPDKHVKVFQDILSFWFSLPLQVTTTLVACTSSLNFIYLLLYFCSILKVVYRILLACSITRVQTKDASKLLASTLVILNLTQTCKENLESTKFKRKFRQLETKPTSFLLQTFFLLILQSSKRRLNWKLCLWSPT